MVEIRDSAEGFAHSDLLASMDSMEPDTDSEQATIVADFRIPF